MAIVNLASGGLDSTLVGVLALNQGITQYPLFIDYGQRAAVMEWKVCRHIHDVLKLPKPVRMNLSGFGEVVRSGLTSIEKNLVSEAFTPGRNLLFILVASAYAFQVGASAVCIGILEERSSIFPDQTEKFLRDAENVVKSALGKSIKIVAPLAEFSKGDVINLAKEYKISGTYSCHSGLDKPCGNCISCNEVIRSTSKES